MLVYTQRKEIRARLVILWLAAGENMHRIRRWTSCTMTGSTFGKIDIRVTGVGKHESLPSSSLDGRRFGLFRLTHKTRN